MATESAPMNLPPKEFKITLSIQDGKLHALLVEGGDHRALHSGSLNGYHHHDWTERQIFHGFLGEAILDRFIPELSLPYKQDGEGRLLVDAEALQSRRVQYEANFSK